MLSVYQGGSRSNVNMDKKPSSEVERFTFVFPLESGACFKCQQLSNQIHLMDAAVRGHRANLVDRQQRIRFLEDCIFLMELRHRDQVWAQRQLRAERDHAVNRLAQLKSEHALLEREEANLRRMIEFRPEKPPPPPPPPPPPAYKVISKFLPWRKGSSPSSASARSKSMSRLDDLRTQAHVMQLNDDILDAIRKKKYALKHVEKNTTVKPQPSSGFMAEILRRRINMAYDKSEDDDEDKDNTDTDSDTSSGGFGDSSLRKKLVSI